MGKKNNRQKETFQNSGVLTIDQTRLKNKVLDSVG